MKKKFNLGPAITFSFQSLRKHPLLIMVPVGIQTIGIVLILLCSDFISKMALINTSHKSIGLGMFPLMMLGFNVVIYLNLIVQILIQIGITRLGFKLFTEEEKPGWKDLFRLDWSIIWKSIGCSLLLGIYITLAILVCMIPGVILYFVTAKLLIVFRIMIISLVAIPLIFFMFYIPVTYTFLIPTTVDTRDTIDHILQKSGKLVKGVKWSVFGYLFLIFIVSFAISQSSTLLKNHGFDWLYYSVSGIFTFLWASLVAMIPIYLYKDLTRQQTLLDVAYIPGIIGEDLAQELEDEQAEELVEESPEL
jgi:hypothetical protein